MAETHNICASKLHSLVRRLFTTLNTPRHIADVVTQSLVNANLAGHDSHGMIRIETYLGGIESGGIDPVAEPEPVKETDNVLVFDGRNGLGIYTAYRAMEIAIEKAKRSSVCCASFVRIGHIGRLGEHAELATRSGCIGMVTWGDGSGTGGATVPFGGAEGALSTNPIAIGVPTGDDTPFISDFATTVIAGGKISVAASVNADLPEGAVIDKNGNPTTKIDEYQDGGYLLTFGGHKGYALALLTCLFAGLSGKFEPERAGLNGTFIQAINVEAFTPLNEYQRNVRAFLDGIKSVTPAPGFDEVLVPGDFEYRSRQERLANGIEFPTSIWSTLMEWAEKLNVPLDGDVVEPADKERYLLAS